MKPSECRNLLRKDALDAVAKALADHYDLDLEQQVCVVSASELAFPVTDAEGNDAFVLIKVSVPRGTRDGNGGYIDYDGYAAADEYKADCDAKAAEKAAKAEDKRREEQERERKRAARKTVKKLNTEGLDNMIHEGV